MRRPAPAIMRLVVAPLLLIASEPAHAKWSADRPLRTQTVKDADGGEISCIFYEDVMIRVPGTDTPSPDDAILVRAGKNPPTCSARMPAGIPVKTSGYAFAGRTSFYLSFEEADPNGPVAFVVIDVRTGRTIIDDVSADGIADSAQMHTIMATPAALTIAFQRGFNTQCSLLASPQSCWHKITSSKANAIPPNIARLAPPADACMQSYREAQVQNEDPSIITYEVQINWTSSSVRNQIRATGPVRCRPMP